MLYFGTALGAAIGGAAASRVAFDQFAWVGVPFAVAGLVTLRRDGRRSIYRARRTALHELRAYLAAFWDAELAGLKAAAERAEREKKGTHERRPRRH